MEIDLELIGRGGNPYERFCDSIRDSETRRKYLAYLRRFLDEVPDNVYGTVADGAAAAGRSYEEKARLFVAVAKGNPEIGHGIIAEYVRLHKERVERGDLNPNTLRNLVKPIHALLDSNGAAIHWKSIYKMYPRPVKTDDRAYSPDELQRMMEAGRDLTDKVILTVFSSAGFRVEAWDYLCWKDVTFFKHGDGAFEGAALQIYRGDPESYFSFITPEACMYLDMYREQWRRDVGAYPKPGDPLLRTTVQIAVKRLNAKGVKARVTSLASGVGLRPKLPAGKRRHSVPIDHGFRKYFNTMMRRAKVDYLDKEDMMGHSTGLEKHYERYCEEDFERFPEYQKAIPFLTISDGERLRAENQALKREAAEPAAESSPDMELVSRQMQQLSEELAKVKRRMEIAERYEKAGPPPKGLE